MWGKLTDAYQRQGSQQVFQGHGSAGNDDSTAQDIGGVSHVERG